MGCRRGWRKPDEMYEVLVRFENIVVFVWVGKNTSWKIIPSSCIYVWRLYRSVCTWQYIVTSIQLSNNVCKLMHMRKCHLRCQTVNTNTRTLQQNSLHSFRCPCVFCFFSQPIFFDKPMDTKNQSPKTFSDFDVIVVPLLYLFNGSSKHDHPIEIWLFFLPGVLHAFTCSYSLCTYEDALTGAV